LEKTGRLVWVECRRSMEPSPQGLTITSTWPTDSSLPH